MTEHAAGRAFSVAFVGVVIAGLLGALIGYGLADVGCTGECGLARAAGTLAGAALSAAGVAVVAVLVLRAMSEWRAQGRSPTSTEDEADAPDPG